MKTLSDNIVLIRFCSYFPFPPIGLLYCADAVKRKKYTPHIKNYSDRHFKKELDKIINEVLEISPLAIGVSLLSTEVAYAAGFSQRLKSYNSRIPIV